jgi:hypothetical protein
MNGNEMLNHIFSLKQQQQIEYLVDIFSKLSAIYAKLLAENIDGTTDIQKSRHKLFQ